MNKIKLLKNIFYPCSICIVGASTKERTVGYELLNNIIKGGYGGKLFPVNPKADKILGIKCFKSLSDFDEIPELTIVILPKQFVLESVVKILMKGCKSIILISAGFKETGKEGEILEKEIVKKVNEYEAVLIGPNCMGVINSNFDISLNATFVAQKSDKSRTAFLSQSGAIGAAVLNSMKETNINFSQFISLGNKADINENDILEFWEKDDNISVITAYLESFEDGNRLIKMFYEKKLSKPVILLKAGKTIAGQKAALSHTGALGTSSRVVDSVCNQFGIIRVDDLNELFNTAKGFEFFPLPNGKKVAVVTNAGGPAILLTDKIENENLALSEFSELTKDKLRKIVHPEGSINNPVDLLPGGNDADYLNAIKAIIEDENVDSVISIFVEPVMVDALSVVKKIKEIDSPKPIFQVVMPLPEFWTAYRLSTQNPKPVFKNPEDPAEIIANMLRFKNLKSLQQRTSNIETRKSSEVARHQFKNGLLKLPKMEKILLDYNLPIIKNRIVNAQEISKLKKIEYPLVIKGLAEAVNHKSDFGGVKINIQNRQELLQAAEEISNSFKKENIILEQFNIQQYIEPSYELLLGGFRDQTFGPMIMFGSGGKFVEIIGDTQIRSAFISEEEILNLIGSTKAGKILAGARGEAVSNLEYISEMIRSTADLMLENPAVSEFDINPLIKTAGNNYVAVDFRMVWNNASTGYI